MNEQQKLYRAFKGEKAKIDCTEIPLSEIMHILEWVTDDWEPEEHSLDEWKTVLKLVDKMPAKDQTTAEEMILYWLMLCWCTDTDDERYIYYIDNIKPEILMLFREQFRWDETDMQIAKAVYESTNLEVFLEHMEKGEGA